MMKFKQHTKLVELSLIYSQNCISDNEYSFDLLNDTLFTS